MENATVGRGSFDPALFNRRRALAALPQFVGDALTGVEGLGVDIDAAFSLDAGVLQVGAMDEDIGGGLIEA
jgi:hypothetical protein